MDEGPTMGGPLSGTGAVGMVPKPSGAVPLPSDTVPLTASDPIKVGNYQLLARLSPGGASVAYLAQASSGTPPVVLKLAGSRPTGGNRLRRNFVDVAGLKMPTWYAAKVLGKGTHDGTTYLVREYCDGMTLAQLVAEDGRLDPVTLNAVAVATAAAIVAVHDAGQAHGNLKPTNVIVALAGVRLLDHGLARQSGQPPPRPADDVLGWARLVASAGTGRQLATTAAESTLDVGNLDRPIGPLVERALSADPEERPSARAILLGLVSPAETGGTGPRWRRRR
ncbi:MAG: hypothetical protein HKP61_08035 [Dactylosporangium sp.]|nr:hypothetical protein [Dactylosporangium sp.]NNJ60886.1 hypothetical protein [Dactylosporangium sp.]